MEIQILTTFTEKALHLVGCTPVRLLSIIRSVVTRQLLHSHR